MKNNINKKIKVYFESLGKSINYERLFRALSLILSEEDITGYLSNNQKDLLNASFDEYDRESKILVEKLVNF